MFLQEAPISGNIAPGGGGGIFTDGTLTLNNCTLSGNSQTPDGYHAGGAIYSAGSNNLYLTNCTISGNTCISDETGGGGIYLNPADAGDVTITNCTIANNSNTHADGNGGGICVRGGGVYIKNTIIANNTADGTADFYRISGIAGTVHNNGYNAVETQNAADFVNGANGCFTGTQYSGPQK